MRSSGFFHGFEAGLFFFFFFLTAFCNWENNVFQGNSAEAGRATSSHSLKN